MNTMVSLLDLQSSSLLDPSAVAALMDARSRLQSMGVMYDKLYCSDNYRDVSINAYLPLLINEIAGLFPNRNMVTIETDMAEFQLSARTLSPLGIIVNELITTTMKYAFIGKEQGTIKISSSLQENRVTLEFEDNGNGLPESIDIEKSAGFGLQLVTLLIKQLKGTVRLERKEGTRFILEFGR
jgi:two-component sensor histidine kinase